MNKVDSPGITTGMRKTLVALLLALVTGCGSAGTEAGDGPTEPLPVVPLVVGERLYVDGERVPGRWSDLVIGGDVWAAAREAGGDRRVWAWGTSATPHLLAPDVVAAVPSMDGRWLVTTHELGGHKGALRVQDLATGQTVGADHPVDLPRGEGRQVTTGVSGADAGRVFLGSEVDSRIWLPASGKVVDLHRTAPGLQLRQVLEGQQLWFHPTGENTSEQFLGSVDDAGRVREGAAVAEYEFGVSPDGGSFARPGKQVSLTIDDVASEWSTTLVVRRSNGADPVTVRAPGEWLIDQWHWELPRVLLVELVDRDGERALARCRVGQPRCRIIDLPG